MRAILIIGVLAALAGCSSCESRGGTKVYAGTTIVPVPMGKTFVMQILPKYTCEINKEN